MIRQLQPCGTQAAWQRHRKHGEKPCEACREAHNQYQRDYHAGLIPARTLKPCGTLAAYRRHVYKGEKACRKCRAAVAADNAARRSATKAAP